LHDAPKMLPYRYQLVSAYPALADLYTRIKQPSRALEALGKAIVLADGLAADYPTFRWMAAEADGLRIRSLLIRLQGGEMAAILPAAGTLAEKKDLSPGNQYDLACLFALASVAAQADRKTSEAQVQRALALLTHLEATGYFRTPGLINHARKDDDLKSLRERQEFKALLDRAEKRLKASAPRSGV
jgi:hypothetical protein